MRLGKPTRSANVVIKINVENLMLPNSLGGKIGSKPKVITWSPEQVLNT